MGAVRTSCRLCRGGGCFPIIDLGATPIANALVEAGASPPDPAYPLALSGCPRCGLVQLNDDLPADVIFDDSYAYLSSYSSSLVEHARQHVEELVEQHHLGPSSFVVEVASNDGYLLRHFVDHDVPVLGIEPAPVPARLAREAGVETIEAFCGEDTAAAIAADRGTADVVLANNVLAHVPDINDFFAGLTTLLADDGVLQIENPHIRSLVDNTLFDTIYHEHYSYLSCSAVAELGTRHGLVLNEVRELPNVHGGSFRWTLSRGQGQSEAVRRNLALEDEIGIRRPDYYEAFTDRVHRDQRELRALLTELEADGQRVAAYACAAKGATLLNTSGIGVDLVPYVVDRNPEKHGKLMPGCRIPCVDPSYLLEDQPDVLLVLAWNVIDEVMAQQHAYAEAGGRFLVPVPEPTFVEP